MKNKIQPVSVLVEGSQVIFSQIHYNNSFPYLTIIFHTYNHIYVNWLHCQVRSDFR